MAYRLTNLLAWQCKRKTQFHKLNAAGLDTRLSELYFLIICCNLDEIALLKYFFVVVVVDTPFSPVSPPHCVNRFDSSVTLHMADVNSDK